MVRVVRMERMERVVRMVNGGEVVRWCTRVSVILIPGDNCEV